MVIICYLTDRISNSRAALFIEKQNRFMHGEKKKVWLCLKGVSVYLAYTDLLLNLSVLGISFHLKVPLSPTEISHY